MESVGDALDSAAATSQIVQPYVSAMAEHAGQAIVVLTVLLLLVAILAEVFKPVTAEVDGPLATPDPGPAVPVAVPVGVATAEQAAQAEARGGLFDSGLSATDVVALGALRQRIERGDVAEGPTSTERLAFARWLVQHGKLSD